MRSIHFHKFQESSLEYKDGVHGLGRGLNRPVYMLLLFSWFPNTTLAWKGPTPVLSVCPHVASETPHLSQSSLFHWNISRPPLAPWLSYSSVLDLKSEYLIQKSKVRRASNWTEKEPHNCQGKKTWSGHLSFSSLTDHSNEINTQLTLCSEKVKH